MTIFNATYIIILITEICLLLIFIRYSKKLGKDVAIDDSAWVFDKEQIYNNLRRFLSKNQENIVALLGIKHAQDIINKNSTRPQGFCMLTEKAYYFIGSVLQKKFLIHRKKNIQYRIVTGELKGVKIGHIYNVVILLFDVLWVFLLYMSIMWIQKLTYYQLTDYQYSYDRYIIMKCYFNNTIMAIPIIFLAVCCLIFGIGYIFTTKRTALMLQFSSETISFPVNKLGENEIKTFYNYVSHVQEIHNDLTNSKDNHATTNQSNSNTIQLSGVDKVERLNKLSKLYEQNLVSEEEFNKLKYEIINN